MNTKNNKRRRETLKTIENVLLECLKTRELSQIRVSDICKLAQINRSTFYANYTDIYDLAEKIKEKLRAEVNPLFAQEEGLRCSDLEFLRLLVHIRDNQTMYRIFFKLGYDGGEDLVMSDAWLSELGLDAAKAEYHVAFFKNGFNAIVRKWLEEGCRESPEEICDILLWEYRARL